MGFVLKKGKEEREHRAETSASFTQDRARQRHRTASTQENPSAARPRPSGAPVTGPNQGSSCPREGQASAALYRGPASAAGHGPHGGPSGAAATRPFRATSTNGQAPRSRPGPPRPSPAGRQEEPGPLPRAWWAPLTW